MNVFEKATASLKNNDFDKMFEYLEKLTKREIMKWSDELVLKHKIDYEEDFYDKLTDEQLKKMQYLLSSEREARMILSKKESERTEQDWIDLKATDWG